MAPKEFNGLMRAEASVHGFFTGGRFCLKSEPKRASAGTTLMTDGRGSELLQRTFVALEPRLSDEVFLL